MPDAFSLLVKPASGDCNLRCDYCFYLPKRELFPAPRRMSPETLEAVTRRFLECPMPVHAFGWQGGEPTLMGLDFYREAVRLQRLHAPRGARVANAFQTNGVLLDDEWAVFLRENRFLVGLSLDGPARLHDRRRRAAGGGGSYAAAERGLHALLRRKVDVNALVLVSDAIQGYPEVVYRHLKSLGVLHHQYIECLEFGEDGVRRPYALSPGRWGKFLCRLFDEWYPRDIGTVSVRPFDSIVSRLATGRPTMCPMDGNCGGYVVVETNGDVFPCDFHVRPELRLGNANTAGFGEMRASETYRTFGAGKDPRPTSPGCADCRWLPLCMGDCPKNRRNGASAFCSDWRMFFEHTIERFERLAARISEPAPGAPCVNPPPAP